MPRYHFHFDDIDGGESLRDGDGHELADDDAARIEAIRIAREIIADGALIGRIDLRHRLQVEERGGGAVEQLDFADAIEIVNA